MSYDVYWVKNRAEKIADFEHPTLQGVLLIAIIPRAMPWAKSFWAFSPFQPYSLKFFVKEFGDFLMSCHQHCLGVNLLV